MKRRWMQWASVIILILSVAIVYATHQKVPFMMDDEWYSTKLFSNEAITSFRDIVEAQIWHYNNWGGRSIAHGMLQVVLCFGEQWADILNVLFTLALACVICRLAKCNKRGDFPLFVCVFGMLFGLNANWKMSMFWQSGALNYLYITVFILWYLCLFFEEDERMSSGAVAKVKGVSRYPIVKAVLLIPLGLVAGWSNENMGPAACMLSLYLLIIWLAKKRKIALWALTGNLACLVGSVLVIIAPGNFVRSGEVAEREYGTLWKLFLRGYAESRAALDYLFPALLIVGFLLFVVKGVMKLRIGRTNMLLLIGALLSWGAMVLSPHYPDRATFGTMTLLICVIISLSKRILEERKDLSWMLLGVFGLVWLRGMYYLGEFLAMCWGWIR